jgi:tetratricopeptide (TPR) repeat protein
MKLRFALLAAASSFIACPVFAADAPAPTAQSPVAQHPWEKDEALLQATIESVSKQGMMAVSSHATDLELALTNAKHSLELAAQDDTAADEPSKSVKDSAVADKPKNVVIPEPNPYPGIGFFLGCYYDQTGKPQDGLRVIKATLDLPGTNLDTHLVDLLIERGAAYSALKQWDDALVSFDDALKLEGTVAGIRAYIHRSRGLVLAEMDRMAESKAAYEEALKLTANDKDAQRDLDMIEKLRDGGPKLPSKFTPPPEAGQAH